MGEGPLDGTLQGEPSNGPKRLGHNGRGRERLGGKASSMTSGMNPEGER